MEEPDKNKMEWVEIIEPKTKEHMYANLTTGECVWDPPPGVLVKRTSDSQWWELFDHKTSRFYYYNAASQRTVWHRPSNCDIIPLAKLQTLKQNTQVKSPGHESNASSNGTGCTADSTGTADSRSSVKKESVATQTPPRAQKPPTEWNGSSRRSEKSRPEESGTKTGTAAPATSPVASPRPHRRHHHHHHHGKSSSEKKNRSDEDDEAPEPLRTTQATDQKKHRRHAGSRKDSGRSSDSSTLSLSVGKRSADKQIPASGSLTSPLRGTPSSGRRFDVDFSFANSSSTPLTSRKKTGSHELSRQRSLDSESGAPPAANSSSRKPNELFYRDGSLSRSLSFMQQRRPQTVRGQGAMFDLWSPQREHHQLLTETGVDSLCTPMINRKQRTFDVGGKSRLQQQQQTLDNPRSGPSKGSRPLGTSASFRTGSSDRRDVIRPLASDSSPSPKREKERDSLKRHDSLLRSADSSPHSAGDSGLATTGSRASQDSGRTKTSGSKTQSSSTSSTGVSATAGTSNGPVEAAEAPGGGEGAIYDPVPLYSNIDYNYYLDPKAQAHLLPLQQYILEQAKLSGYRFADSSPVTEEAEGRAEFRSDDEEDSGHRRLRVPAKTHHRLENNDDSDDFADDEGMSNVDDSSSNEYLDESQYLEEDDHYTQFLLQPIPPQRMQSKTTLQHFSGPGLTVPAITPSSFAVPTAVGASNGAAASDVIVEPEYSEADPGCGITGTYRSLPDGPSSGAHLNAGSSSSLRHRPKEPMHPTGSLYSPVMERPGPFSMDAFRQATEAVGAAQKSMSLQRSPSTPSAGKGPTTPTDGDIEKYAQNNLNIHKKGLFRKNLSIRDMLSWSKDSISKPMLPLDDKLLKKEACDLFKLVQIYMGDRKCKPGMTCNSVALELCNHAWNKPGLRDELYLHICRQTTENPRKDSLRRGWELMAVCLYFFPPSPKLEPYLDGYINRHRDPGLNFTEVAKWPIHVQVSHYATISCRRLARIGASGRRQERKPTLEEIEQARLQIFRPSMFGNTLEEIMSVQRDRFPHRKLPWIQTTLSEEILRLHGAQTEGIFRVPADVDEVNNLKNHMDQWEVISVSDAHVPASLLKLWYRELYESLIPDELYQECVQYCTDPERAVAVVHRLPEFHKLVLSYLIRFLQIFAQTEVATVTKMDASNLAMVMAPNCLRCNASDPKVIFDNARKEMAFVRTLIQHLDTSFMEGVV